MSAYASEYGLTVDMPGCGHLVAMTVPVTLTVPEPGERALLVLDQLACRRALRAHVRTCPQAQAVLPGFADEPD